MAPITVPVEDQTVCLRVWIGIFLSLKLLLACCLIAVGVLVISGKLKDKLGTNADVVTGMDKVKYAAYVSTAVGSVYFFAIILVSTCPTRVQACLHHMVLV